MPQIFVFGDSIAHGMWDSEGGWPIRLKCDLYKNRGNEYIAFYNLSIPGETTEETLKRFDREVEDREDESQEYIFIFALGINDSSFHTKSHDPSVSLDNFEKNFKKLIEKALDYTDQVYLVGLTMVDEDITSPVTWMEDVTYINARVELYDQKMKKICEDEEVQYIDIRKSFSEKKHKSLLEDGLHPNTKGHKLIYEIAKRALSGE